MNEKEAGGIPPWFVKMGSTTKQPSVKYGGSQQEEMSILRQFYAQLCWPQEKGHTLSTLDIKSQPLIVNETTDPEFPIFFRTTSEHKPEFLVQGFFPIIEFGHWTSHLNKDSSLLTPIKKALGYLCEAQCRKAEGSTDLKYSYDPVYMFFEELKSWLVMLSLHPNIDNVMLNITEGRYLFLCEVLSHKELFREAKLFVEAIDKVRAIFSSEILPCIASLPMQAVIGSQFEKFKKNIQTCVKSAVLFVFYVMRDIETPEKFGLDEMRNDLSSIANSTISGRLLRELLNSPAVKHVLPGEVTFHANAKSACTNNFMDDVGSGVYPAEITECLNKNPAYPFGLFVVFKDHKETMAAFLRLHGLIQKLSTFCVIFEQFVFHGNNHRYALKPMREAMLCYKKLYADVVENIQFLYEKAEFTMTLMKWERERKESQQWKKNFHSARNIYPALMKTLGSSNTLVHELEMTLCNVVPVEPKGQIKQEMEFFLQLMHYFSGKIKSSDIIHQGRNANEFNYSPQTPVKPRATLSSPAKTPK